MWHGFVELTLIEPIEEIKMRKVPIPPVKAVLAVVEERSDSVDDAELEFDAEVEPIMLRPNGYYWRTPRGRQDYGPFATWELAMADRDAADEDAPEPGETLQEAEDEIGISDWIDPETGEPAERQSPPRVE
jgi:hypothetical protein